MEKKIDCRLIDENVVINLQDEAKKLDINGQGAVVWFYGHVRPKNNGKEVAAIYYEASVPHAVAALEAICNEAIQSISKELNFLVIHRLGHLPVGEWSIVIGVSSAHRSEAYQASQYVIEQIKARVPIWKNEIYQDNSTAWLKGNKIHGNTCDHSSGR